MTSTATTATNSVLEKGNNNNNMTITSTTAPVTTVPPPPPTLLPTTTTTTTTTHHHNNNNNSNINTNNPPPNVRKASNASTISSHRSSNRSMAQHSNHSSSSIQPAVVPGNSSSSLISDRRLPRKKRKESNDDDHPDQPAPESQQQQQSNPDEERNRNNSLDYSVAISSSFPDLGLRLDPSSTTTTTSVVLVRRKSSQDTTGTSSTLGLPSLDDGMDGLVVLGGGTAHYDGGGGGTTTNAPPTAGGRTMDVPNLCSSNNNNSNHSRSGKANKRDRSETINSTSQHSLVSNAREHSKQGTTGSAHPTTTTTTTASILHHSNHTNHNKSATATIASMDDHHPLPLKSGPADDNSSQDETFASSGHRVLMEAILMSGAGSASTATGPGGGMATAGTGGGSSKAAALPLEPIYSSSMSFAGGNTRNVNFPYRERLDSTASSFRYSMFNGRRDRLESWGGMSDLSVGPNASDSVIATAVAAATNLHNGLLFEDPDHDDVVGQLPALQMSASFSHDDQRIGGAIPSKISVPPYRDRLGSIASLGDLSVSNLNNNLTIDGIDVPGSDLHAFVAAAMASVGDQLIEFAGAMEEITGESMTSDELHREFIMNDGGDCSVASPLIGAVSDVAGARRPRAWSTSSRLPVDIEAVNAAVEAAYSVGMVPMVGEPEEVKSNAKATKKRTPRILKRSLPTKKTRNEISTSSSQSTTSENQQSNAVPKAKNSKKRPRKSETSETSRKATPKSMVPIKKRPLEKVSKTSKAATPSSDAAAMAAMKTPIASNRTLIEPTVSELNMTPAMVLSMAPEGINDSSTKNCGGDGGGSGQANQKWEKMFECMIEFAEERKAEDTKDMTDDEKKTWVWDGNVPTNYKSKDGMALGRWVNNQRSAKAKGTLKDDREQRLISAGLKWSVLASNSWNEMLEELSIYIKDQHRQGKVWDGNVPTNYQIKSRPDGGFNGEDKNLGRWVNRQRSLFQSGKLRKERKIQLEGVGLKWSMLATTSWDGMYDTLREYAEQQIKKMGGEKWDGNVPANYRTSDNPPRALGRWVNRQRSAFAKKKLKNEFVEKLNVLGLKWSVHHRPDEMDENDDGEFGDGEFEDPIDTVVPEVTVSMANDTEPNIKDGAAAATTATATAASEK